jgi:hypothetical protein
VNTVIAEKKITFQTLTGHTIFNDRFQDMSKNSTIYFAEGVA